MSAMDKEMHIARLDYAIHLMATIHLMSIVEF